MDVRTVGDAAIRVVIGDITTLPVDAVVNAANERLDHGGGVAASIARAGAPDVNAESKAWIEAHGLLTPGVAAVTSAGPMPARMVVHVVGPRYAPGRRNEALLRQAVAAALDAAATAGARSVALPAISAGIFGYPRAAATAVIAAEVARWLAAFPGRLAEVQLVAFDVATADDFRNGLDAG